MSPTANPKCAKCGHGVGVHADRRPGLQAHCGTCKATKAAHKFVDPDARPRVTA